MAEIANKAGIQIPEEIQAGINAGGTQAVSAMQELLALIQQQAADAQSAGEDVGTAVGEGTQNSIKDQQSGVEQAGGEMASAGAKAAEEKKGEYEKAGSVAAQQYQTGINSGKVVQSVQLEPWQDRRHLLLGPIRIAFTLRDITQLLV